MTPPKTIPFSPTNVPKTIPFGTKATAPNPFGLSDNLVEGAENVVKTVKELPGKLVTNTKETFTDVAKDPLHAPSTIGKGLFRNAGDIAIAATSPVAELFGAGLKTAGNVQDKITDIPAVQKFGESVKAPQVSNFGIKEISDYVGNNPAVQQFAMKHPQAEEDFNRALTLLLTAAGGIKGGKAEPSYSRMDFEGPQGGSTMYTKPVGRVEPKPEATAAPMQAPAPAEPSFISQLKQKVIDNAPKGILKTKVTAEDFAGRILRGESADNARMVAPLTTVDVAAIKPGNEYGSMQALLNNKVQEVSKVLDVMLEAKKGTKKLGQLATSEKVGGKTVTQNFVKDAFEHLKELYEKTNDGVAATKIKQLEAKAKRDGLTIKEVNDLARQYGTEVKNKAFNPVTGEPRLTINAAAFENVRSGIKKTARDIFDDPAYAAMDKELADLIRARELTDLMKEKVHDQMVKIVPRTVIQELTHKGVNVIDFLTRGIVKETISSLLPRGRGLKEGLQPLDLQRGLVKNLKELQNAARPGTHPRVIERVLNKLGFQELINSLKSQSTAAMTESTANIPKNAQNTTGMNNSMAPQMATNKSALAGNERSSSIASSVHQDPTVVKKAIALTKKNGGVTISLQGDIPKKGFSYAPSKATETKVPVKEWNAESLSAFKEKHREALSEPGMHLGTWLDDEGNIVMDVSRVETSFTKAMEAAGKSEQDAIFDLQNLEVHNLKDYEKVNDTYTRRRGPGEGGAGDSATVEGKGAAGRAGEVGRIEIKSTETNTLTPRQADIIAGLSSKEKAAFLKQKAATAKMFPKFETAMKKINEGIDAEQVGPNRKGDPRTIEKALDGRDKFDAIKDMNRGAYVIKDPAMQAKLLTNIRKQFKTIKVKDRMKKSTTEGYRDTMVQVKMPNGTWSEIQIYSPKMAAMKEKLHPMYEKTRVLIGKLNKGEKPTPEQWKEYAGLILEMRKGYDSLQ